MPKYVTDVLIKTLRIQRGIMQKELAKGICTQDTLSRIERGLRKPDWYTFERLMQRLGEDPSKYYFDIITKNDKYILDTKDKLTNLVRSKKIDEVEKTLQELEHDELFQEPVHLQFVVRMKATVAHARKDYPNTYTFALEAIKITKPDFNEDEVDTYVLSYDEIMLINLISVAHFHTTSIEKSTELLLKLKDSIDKAYFDDAEKSKTYIRILFNISENLILLKRSEEAIAICDEGLKYCVIYRDSHFHPLVLFNKAHALFLLDRKEEGTELFINVCALFQGLERYNELKIAKDYFKNEFNITI